MSSKLDKTYFCRTPCPQGTKDIGSLCEREFIERGTGRSPALNSRIKKRKIPFITGDNPTQKFTQWAQGAQTSVQSQVAETSK